ncbi:MAG: hypothetical protein SV375_11750 [Thermodesulfobacteriota bacterium]|nr:hypothetical protein [Thermodesulfobacteriota bacterium]
MQVTNASSIDQLEGISASIGGSLGPGVQATGEVIIGPNGLWGGNLGIPAGPGLPVELHGVIEQNTIDYKVNLVDLFIDFLVGKITGKGQDECE